MVALPVDTAGVDDLIGILSSSRCRSISTMLSQNRDQMKVPLWPDDIAAMFIMVRVSVIRDAKIR